MKKRICEKIYRKIYKKREDVKTKERRPFIKHKALDKLWRITSNILK